ncbi:MAG: thiamine diphosphokinase [Oscillospiraceae bacterium]|jgi:thiamine pyrophosphokinase|nr:thiamine diphosphokinase [Oscillospiraceae bacterium]
MQTTPHVRCHVVGAAGLQGSVPQLAAGDLLIAADAGWLALQAVGLVPDLVVGDFDSAIAPTDIPIERLNPIKDETDLYAALRMGRQKGYRHFVLYGALGGSWGHSTANLQILAGLVNEGFGATILAENVRVTAVHNGTLTLDKAHGTRVSVLAFGGKAEGVTLAGFRYPLNSDTLTPNFPLGVSNHIVTDIACVAVTEGTLLVFQENENK